MAIQNPKSEIQNYEVLDLLGSLTDKSLVLAEHRDGTTRYRLLETVRQYAQDRLSETDARSTGEDATATTMRRSRSGTADGWAGRAKGSGWIPRRQNTTISARPCASAWRSLGTPRRRSGVVGSVWRFWLAHGRFTEGRQHIAAALDHPDAAEPTYLRGVALSAVGHLANSQADNDAARSYYQQSLDVFELLGDREGRARCLHSLGNVVYDQGDYAARAHSTRRAWR